MSTSCSSPPSSPAREGSQSKNSTVRIQFSIVIIQFLTTVTYLIVSRKNLIFIRKTPVDRFQKHNWEITQSKHNRKNFCHSSSLVKKLLGYCLSKLMIKNLIDEYRLLDLLYDLSQIITKKYFKSILVF